MPPTTLNSEEPEKLFNVQRGISILRQKKIVMGRSMMPPLIRRF